MNEEISSSIASYIDQLKAEFNINTNFLLTEIVNDYNYLIITPSLNHINDYFNEFKNNIKDIISDVSKQYNFIIDMFDVSMNKYSIQIVYSLNYGDIIDDTYNLNIETLPSDMIRNTLLNLDYTSIKQFCLSSKEYRKICDDSYFWRLKFNHDFGINPHIKYTDAITLEQLYLEQNSLYLTGYDERSKIGYKNNIYYPIRVDNIKIKLISTYFSTGVFTDKDDNVYIFGLYNPTSLLESIPFKATKLKNIKAKKISAGNMYAMFIDLNDDVYSYGTNWFGQLGIGTLNRLETPTKIPNIKGKEISCGASHSMIIDLNSNVYSFGNNKHGQLGHNDNIVRKNPTKIPNIQGKSISCSVSNSFIIDENDNIYAFGKNDYGMLGLGDSVNRFIPTIIPSLKGKMVLSGHYHTLILDIEGNVYSCGHNSEYQLGISNIGNSDVPIKINNYMKDKNIYQNIKAKYISCGHSHSAIIDVDNNLYTFGSYYHGRLGLGKDVEPHIPTQVSNIFAKTVACGTYNTCIVYGIS